MQNMPQVKLGVVAVSRDCFPITLSQRRRAEVVRCFRQAGGEIFEAPTTPENETDAMQALKEIQEAGVNALVVYLGNFGPEGPETLLAQQFGGPVMFVAAAEEDTQVLLSDRGDAYCGMLNASYNIGLRGFKAYIPEYPVGTPNEVSAMIAEFIPIARVLLGLKKLKVFSFGPRPFDFLACNAPIAPLFKLGINIQENSELDLYDAYLKHKDDPRIEAVAKDMADELGVGNKMPGVLPRLAQYELTLLDWAEQNKGAAEYFVFANKCWPAFESFFGFVP
ncbi:MAG: fucose isomerase, partial [Oscillospiraceae bacterium]|nr:fucose isomerase [Oscillospiraceae bacterium]